MLLVFISWLAVILSSVQLIPQAIKEMETKGTRDVSLTTYLIFMLASTLWIIHGVANHDIPIIVANIVAFVSATVVVVLKLKYQK